METLISCSKVKYSIDARLLFDELSVTISDKDRIALVGYNGAGKTHLLKLLAGHYKPDDGLIEHVRGLKLEMVSQFIDESLLAMTLLDSISQKIRSVDEFADYKASKALYELGFTDADFSLPVSALSGGQKTKLMFAMAAIVEPDIILFDEPSNHLDAGTMKLFEHYLNARLKCAFIIVSHDRDFLDQVTNQTLFLRDRQLTGFALPFSAAFAALREKDAADAERLRAEEKNISRLKESSKRLAEWGKNYDNEKFARKAKSIEKRVEKLEKAKTRVTAGETYQLTLDSDQIKSKNILQIEKQHIGYLGAERDNSLFFIEQLYIRPGDRIALLGNNGAGKSTLLHTIVTAYAQRQGQGGTHRVIPADVTLSPQCSLGFLDQELSTLPLSQTIFDAVRDNAPDVDDVTCKKALIAAGFEYAEFSKRISLLSGGERSRLLFLILKINKPNFLILDEPTNHLDIFGKIDLETELIRNQITMLVTSHDRAFIDNVANRFIMISDAKLEEVSSSQAYYDSIDKDIATAAAQVKFSSTRTPEPPTNANLSSEEMILDMIIQLENKLADDLSRKPKHQKPHKHAQWRNEIKNLYAKLN